MSEALRAKGGERILVWVVRGSLLPGLRCVTKPHMNVMLEASEAAILDRVFQPHSGDWPRVAAEAILGIGFDHGDRERMTGLLERATPGELTPREARTLKLDRHVGTLMSRMRTR